MSTTYTPPPAGAVVVGIGPEGTGAALGFAAEEARLSHAPLHLVHVLQISPAEGFSGVVQGAIEAAEARVEEASTEARRLVDGEVPVTAELLDEGWLVADLVARASHARMLVLEHRRQSRVRRLVTGSTVAGVAARSVAPVVSVPEDWPDNGNASALDVVTVGVQHPEEAEALVRRGIEEALLRDAAVEVVHAWYLDGGYDSVVADAEFRAERTRQVTEAMTPVLDRLGAEHPDLPLHLRVRHAVPLGALVESADGSRLLVIGRRHHRLPTGSHLGPVTRGVLQWTTGPVLINPEIPVPVDRARAGERREVVASSAG